MLQVAYETNMNNNSWNEWILKASNMHYINRKIRNVNVWWPTQYLARALYNCVIASIKCKLLAFYNSIFFITHQWYFSFKIHFSFSFYKFFSQSFLFLYYISIDLNNYLSFYKFLHQSFLFYIISVLPETIISVLSSFD